MYVHQMKGLEDYQAIKCGDNYLITLPAGSYEINGIPVTVGYQGFQCAISDLEGIVKVTTPIKEALHYINKEGEVISKEIYSGALGDCHKYYDEDCDEHLYPSLEVGFELRKKMDWLNTYTAVYNDPDKIKEPVSITVIGSLEPTGSDFIESSLSIGSVAYTGSSMFKVKLQGVAMKAARDASEKLGVPLETSSSIRYLKVGGKYVMSTFDLEGWTTGATPFRYAVKLEDAKVIEKELYDKVYKHILAMLSDQVVDANTIKYIYGDLVSIYDRLYSLEVKAKGSASKRALLGSVSKLRDCLKEEV